MSSEQVSDDKLEGEITAVKRGIEWNADIGEEPFVSFERERVAQLLSLLTELKSRRAQEPPAGCAKMATTLADLAERIAEDLFVKFKCMNNITVEEFDQIRIAILFRLDAALGKGDADGGREEVESE